MGCGTYRVYNIGTHSELTGSKLTPAIATPTTCVAVDPVRSRTVGPDFGKLQQKYAVGFLRGKNLLCAEREYYF